MQGPHATFRGSPLMSINMLKIGKEASSEGVHKRHGPAADDGRGRARLRGRWSLRSGNPPVCEVQRRRDGSKEDALGGPSSGLE